MDQDPIELNHRTYNQIAAQYAVINAAMPSAVVKRAARMIAQIRPGSRLLDLGCGPGRDLAWFEAHGMKVIGADLSSGMLAEARHVAKSGLCQMEMRALGFATGSFSGVWCSAALLHLPKKMAPLALAEIVRVLAPCGHFYLSIQKGTGEVEECNPYLGNELRFFARYDALEMAHLLEQTGFWIINRGENQSGRTWLWYEMTKRIND